MIVIMIVLNDGDNVDIYDSNIDSKSVTRIVAAMERERERESKRE
jgi:hypothetical protein